MFDDFDPSVYARAPKLDVPSAIALGIRLLAAVPKQPPLAVRKAAKVLHQKIITLQSTWKARDRMEKRLDARPVDVLADNAMNRLFGRIEDYAGLPSDQYPLAERAQILLGTLFPEGLAFLKSDYASQWAETQKRIERIDEENLADDLDKIAGPEFLAEVRRIHKIYGEAIGITKPRAEAAMPNLAVPLRNVGVAMTLHALQLVTVIMDEEAPMDMRVASREALRPFDEYRASVRRDTPEEEETAAATATVPEVEN